MNRSEFPSPTRDAINEYGVLRSVKPLNQKRSQDSMMMHLSEPSISFDEFGFSTPIWPSNNGSNSASDSDSGHVVPVERNRRERRHRRSPGLVRRSGQGRPRNSSTLKRLSSSAVAVVDSLLDSSSNSTNSARKAQQRKESFLKIQGELKRGPTIPDVVARLQTPPEAAVFPANERRRTSSKKREEAALTLNGALPGSDHTGTSTESFAVMELEDKPKPEAVSSGCMWTCCCGSKMSDRMKFCGMCGGKKHWTCKSCKFDENLRSFAYCGGCGTTKNW
ncbi:expressed unknown protein [Seminavis robusta]|uniref:Uncharacterized protein n=1 Tax=Seminavis robusta TaxID=568900 RepID=A0A9N8HEB9_9STRA|nr:expressed unknown protein [Seminavis robusta]|eukprot:Sro508_g156700.1 n/a (278) ;mRNA; f:21695-22528